MVQGPEKLNQNQAFFNPHESLVHSNGLYPDGADVQTLYDAGLLFNCKKNYQQATDCFEKAYDLYCAQKKPVGEARCLIELAWIKHNHGDVDGASRATRLFSDAQELIDTSTRQTDMSEAKARLLHYQGLVNYRHGQFGEAVKNFKIAKTFCSPDGLEAAKIEDSFGIHYERIGDFHRAVQSLKKAMAIKQALAKPYEQAITGHILGRLYLLYEEYPLALAYLEDALKIAQEIEDFNRVASIKNELIKLCIYTGDIPRAQKLIEEAETENQKRGFRVPYAMTLLYSCYLLFIQKHYTDCRDKLSAQIIPIFKKHPFKKGYGIALRLLGASHNFLGEPTHGIESMGEAIATFREGGLYAELAKTHFELGKIYQNLQENKLALASLLEALKLAETNGLSFLIQYIEDEIFRVDEPKWREIVDKRVRHERIFEKEHTLLDALSALSEEKAEDPTSNDHAKSLISLLRVGQAMAGERDLEKLLYLIKDETERALNADRCTVFLYDRDKNELWSKVASGLGSAEEIRFPAHLGLAGYVAKTGETLNIQKAYDDPRFNQDVDKKTGYKTENLICLPMRNRKMEIIGVFQVLNKRNGFFEKADEDLLMAISSSAGVAIENAQLATDQKTAFDSFIKTLSSTIDARDPITAGHSERVADYSLLLGEQLHMPDEDLEALMYASLLHDIGKIGIREEVLTKDGRLTEKEYRHIQKHVFYTYEILKNIHFERHLSTVPEIAASHHEKMDGSGYFRGLSGLQIPLSGRIMAVSDVFDAITSRRHYRNRMPFDKVLGILKRDAGTHFDPDCLDAFMDVELYRLSQVLVKEKTLELSQQGLAYVKALDKNITIREYADLLGKPNHSKAEDHIHTVFTSLYHHNPISDMD